MWVFFWLVLLPLAALGFLLWVPPRPALLGFSAVWLAAMAADLLLPRGTPLPAFFWIDLRVWAAASFCAVIILLYRVGVTRLWQQARQDRDVE